MNTNTAISFSLPEYVSNSENTTQWRSLHSSDLEYFSRSLGNYVSCFQPMRENMVEANDLVKPITMLSDKDRLQLEIKSIMQECSSDGWDGYDAKPIDIDSIQNVVEFIKKLPHHISYPEPLPEPNGDLTMVWRQHGYHLVIGIDNERKIAWGGTSPEGHIYGDVVFKNDIPEEIISLLDSIHRAR
ncbi:MAG: hypothetical protein HAW67_07300 [Endozoicomonadaceae bacterium]|nr:hypothetical protein [Endozoicomonadaceae bacterium]